MITAPTLIIDEQKCRANIRRMAKKAADNGIDFRPHFKTHQSLEIGRWNKESGIKKIAVSSIQMARYFAPEWDDITIAFPVNIREIENINSLAASISLNLCIENMESLQYLKKNLTSNVGFFLKIDVGYHRTGLDPSKIDFLQTLLKEAASSPRLTFRGFLGHAGHSYKCRSRDEVISLHNESTQLMTRLKAIFADTYPDVIVSLGDTPSSSMADDFSGIDELRPGNYVFYDLMQQQIGSCTVEEIAVAMACPIVARHRDRSEYVIHGGAVHLSKEAMDHRGLKTYGIVAEMEDHGWGNMIPEIFIKSLSQEHGIVSVPDAVFEEYKVGDLLYILPVHSCLTANLAKEYLSTTGRIIEKFH